MFNVQVHILFYRLAEVAKKKKITNYCEKS